MNKLFKILDVVPNNKEIYLEAISHSTYSNETRYNRDYQRLEFLGDAIIDKIVSEYIYIKFIKLSEGKMSLLRAKVVSTDALAKYTDQLELMQFVKFGNGSDSLIGNKKIKADIFESLSAAIFLDKGEEALKIFLSKTLIKSIDKFAGKEVKSPKTLLQELLQTESRESITYETTEKDEVFEAKIIHDGKTFGVGIGKNRKDAEVNAAIDALKKTNR